MLLSEAKIYPDIKRKNVQRILKIGAGGGVNKLIYGEVCVSRYDLETKPQFPACL
jgi:hypothetical protein